jgi:hypothetical protein
MANRIFERYAPFGDGETEQEPATSGFARFFDAGSGSDVFDGLQFHKAIAWGE